MGARSPAVSLVPLLFPEPRTLALHQFTWPPPWLPRGLCLDATLSERLSLLVLHERVPHLHLFNPHENRRSACFAYLYISPE